MVSLAEPEPIDGVIFDFHGTLVDGGDAGRWVGDALRHLAESGSGEPVPEAGEVAALTAHLDEIWRHAHTIDPGSERDLDPELHREVFGRAVALCPGVGPELIGALYAVMADQWTVFEDTAPVLRGLKARGVRTVVVSNIAVDIRPCLKRGGVDDLLDGLVLSFEVGLVKPDPAIYERALEVLGVPGRRALMVGDSVRDDVGGVPLKIRTLILPRTEGAVHGLGTVLRMAWRA
ncbi:HAD family hydrolase [Actinoplanes sp. CA-131856]